MTAIPAVPSEPPLTGDAALSDAELAEILDNVAEHEAGASAAPWQIGESWAGEGISILTAEGYPIAVCGLGSTAHDDAAFVAELRNAWPRLVASLRSARKELEAARVVTTLYAWTGGGQETERELALFQAWHEYVITYGTPNPSDEWDQRIADLAARRRARQAEVRAGLAKIVTTEEGTSRG